VCAKRPVAQLHWQEIIQLPIKTEPDHGFSLF
jgi:hypothetical protein